MNWPTVPLKRLASIRTSNVDKKTVDDDPAVRLCNYTDVYYRDSINPSQDFMRATASPDQVTTFRLKTDDVIITKDSETADDIGVPTYVEASAPNLVCGYHLALIRPLQKAISGRFLFWAMASSLIRSQLEVAATGITRFGLRADAIGSATLALPPLPTQRAIADFLDAETARIDALIAKKRRMIELLDERDRRMIDECFAPRSGETLVRLARFANIQTGITLHEGRALEGEVVTLPYLRVANVQPGWLDLSEVKSVTIPKHMASRSTLRAGDVLMTEGGDRDKLGRGTVWRGEIPDCLHQNHVFAVRPDPLSLNSDYLGHLTRTSHARAYFEVTGSQSTNLASTSASKVADFAIPALSTDEQRARVDRYGRFTVRNKRISTALTKQVDLLAEHRQVLITAAVTGEIEVPGAGTS